MTLRSLFTKENRLKLLFTLLMVAFIGFIFLNSMQTADTSSMQSGFVTGLLQKVVNALHLPVTVSEHFVRKLAHFSEYAVLGTLLCVTCRMYTCRILSHLFTMLFIGLAVPVADESIQLFVSGRAGMVQDVVLDFAGVATGLAVTLLIVILIMRRIKR